MNRSVHRYIGNCVDILRGGDNFKTPPPSRREDDTIFY